MSAGAFGAAAVGDRGFVASVRNGRNLRLGTVDRALAVMGAPPAGPAFRREVEAFLAVTGIKRSLFGQEATGNPSFVAHLLGGVSPTLATVEAVRAAMRSLASPAERHEVRARAGAMPALLTGAPWPRPALPAEEPPGRPVAGSGGMWTPARRRPGSGFPWRRWRAGASPGRGRGSTASGAACATGATIWRRGLPNAGYRREAGRPRARGWRSWLIMTDG